MSSGFTFSASSLFYIILLTIMYFSRKRLKAIENQIYGNLIICNFIGVILAIMCYYTITNMQDLPLLNYIISKSLLLYYLAWISIFTTYVFVIGYNRKAKDEEDKKKNYQKLKKIFLLLYLIISIVVCCLPLYFHNANGVVYSYGPSANILYLLIPVYITSFFVYMLKNIKYLKNKQFIPLFMFIIIGTIVMIIQKLNPGLLLMTAMETFITFLMYFTMENPDVKMIEELTKNQNITNQTLKEKTNFLFVASNKIRNPLAKIIDLSNPKENVDLDIKLKEINNLANCLNFTVENIMNVSTLDVANIKITDKQYNVKQLLEKIELSRGKEINSNIDFRLNITNILPDHLYGDKILVEQIINSLLTNAIKNTDHGFIELTVDSIVKFDMCRLIITVADSGKGISIDKVNDLLMIEEKLNENELKRLETKDININTIKKIIKKMGGYFTLISELNKGTEVKFVIDQKIVEGNNIFYNSISNKNQVLILSDDLNFIKNISKKLEKKDMLVKNSVYAKDVLDQIKYGEKYKYILIDDNIEERALPILRELKKDTKFKIPVIVLLNETTEKIKEHFLEDGFHDYILKSDLKNEIDRIFK